MEWAYGLFGEYRIDYFFSMITAWFPLWVFLVTEFILLKPLPIYIYFIYFCIVPIVYLIFCHTSIDIMPLLFYVFWIYYYFAVSIYCSFILSVIILLIEYFKIISRVFFKIKKTALSCVLFIYISKLISTLILWIIFFYFPYICLHTLYKFLKKKKNDFKYRKF